MGILREKEMVSESGQPIERCLVKQELKISDVKLLKKWSVRIADLAYPTSVGCLRISLHSVNSSWRETTFPQPCNRQVGFGFPCRKSPAIWSMDAVFSNL